MTRSVENIAIKSIWAMPQGRSKLAFTISRREWEMNKTEEQVNIWQPTNGLKDVS